MVERIDEHVARRESFALETTLSGLGYARKIRTWRAHGYDVELFFLRLRTTALAVERVAARVQQGGHDIPAATIVRRFETGRRLVERLYKPLVDQWSVYDNSGSRPVLIEWSEQKMADERTMREPCPDYQVPPSGISDRLKGAFAAMQRAADRAREIARQTGTDIVVMQDGEIVHLRPDSSDPIQTGIKSPAPRPRR